MTTLNTTEIRRVYDPTKFIVDGELDYVGPKVLDTVAVLCDEVDNLRALLTEGNELLRSTHAVAERYEDDDKTNWSGFKQRLNKVLQQQHDFMYPKAVDKMKVAVCEYLLGINREFVAESGHPLIPPTAINWLGDGIVTVIQKGEVLETDKADTIGYEVLIGYSIVVIDSIGPYMRAAVYADVEEARSVLRKLSNEGRTCFLIRLTRIHGSNVAYPVATKLFIDRDNQKPQVIHNDVR